MSGAQARWSRQDNPSQILRVWIPTALLLGITAVMYAPTLGNSLVSDDYVWLARVATGPASVVQYHGGYHYNPVTLAVLYVEYALWGLNGACYHAVTIALHIATTLLVARLGFVLTGRSLIAWLAALLFATSSLAYEVPLWAIGVYYSLSTGLYIASLLAFNNYRRTQRRAFYWLFLIFFLAALLAHEQAITLILVCAGYELLVQSPRLPSRSVGPASHWRTDLRSLLMDFALPVAMIVTFVALKFMVSDGTNQLPGVGGSIIAQAWSLAHNLVMVLGVNVPATWAGEILSPPWPFWAKTAWRLMLVVAGAACLLRLPRIYKFLVLWTVLQLATMAVASGIDPRHRYLPLVPASLLMATLGTWGLDAARRINIGGHARRVVIAATQVVIILIGIGIVVVGVHDLQDRKRVWGEASQIASGILVEVGRFHAAYPSADSLFAVNLPDGLPSGDTAPAYVFRLGFRQAVAFLYPGAFARVELLRTTEDPYVSPFGRPVSPDSLRELASAQDNLVLVYDPGGEGVQLALDILAP